MAVSAAALIHTDDLLAQNGIGAPPGFGYSMSGYCALWLQPWLFVALRAGAFQDWAMSLGKFTAVGFVSGAILAVLAVVVVRRWRSCFWPCLGVFGALTIACASYALRNHWLLERALSEHYHG